MSFCREEGKDRIVFDVEDGKPSKVVLEETDDKNAENWTKGFVLDDGTLNWECTCRGSMVASRCGAESREFFTCLYKNKDEDEKTLVCMDEFDRLRDCMQKNNVYYKLSSFDNSEEDENAANVVPEIDDKKSDSKSEISSGLLDAETESTKANKDNH